MLLLLSAGVLAIGVRANAQSLDVAEIANRLGPTVFEIRGSGPEGEFSGSGFVITRDGKAVTNLHVIASLDRGAVEFPSGDVYDNIRVVATDARRDLAILQLPGFDLQVAPLGDANALQPGDPVVLIGNPYGLRGTVTTGVIGGIRDHPDGFQTIQTDAAANPGNSGGPLVNMFGEVVGVCGFRFRDAEGLTFAVPINYVRGMLNVLHDPLTLAELRTELDLAVVPSDDPGALGSFDPATGEPAGNSITLAIRHRHMFPFRKFHHATLRLFREAIQFDETDDDSHDFVVMLDEISHINSASVTAGIPSYTLHFSESTPAGNRITFEAGVNSLTTLLNYLEDYAPHVAILR